MNFKKNQKNGCFTAEMKAEGVYNKFNNLKEIETVSKENIW